MRRRRRGMRGVEHTGEWEFSEGGPEGTYVGRYIDANGNAWNAHELLGQWAAEATPEKPNPTETQKSAPFASAYDAQKVVGSSRDELQGKIDAIADRAWDESLRAPKGGGSGAVVLLALLAFGSKKKRRRAR